MTLVADSRHARAVQVAAAAMIGVMLLSGCAGADPNPTPAADLTEDATAEQPSGPTIVITDSSPDPWLIDFTGVGPIRIDSAVGAADMSAFDEVPHEHCPTVHTYAKPGFPTILIPDLDGTGVVEQIVLRPVIPVPDPSAGNPSTGVAVAVPFDIPRTTAGVGIGSPLAQLEAKHPSITLQGEHNGSQRYAMTDDAGHWITFAMQDGVIDTIVVSDSPDIADEFCG